MTVAAKISGEKADHQMALKCLHLFVFLLPSSGGAFCNPDVVVEELPFSQWLYPRKFISLPTSLHFSKADSSISLVMEEWGGCVRGCNAASDFVQGHRKPLHDSTGKWIWLKFSGVEDENVISCQDKDGGRQTVSIATFKLQNVAPRPTGNVANSFQVSAKLQPASPSTCYLDNRPRTLRASLYSITGNFPKLRYCRGISGRVDDNSPTCYDQLATGQELH